MQKFKDEHRNPNKFPKVREDECSQIFKEINIKVPPVKIISPIPVFQAASIKAMSPMEQEIAAILQEAGYIRIIEDRNPYMSTKTSMDRANQSISGGNLTTDQTFKKDPDMIAACERAGLFHRGHLKGAISPTLSQWIYNCMATALGKEQTTHAIEDQPCS